MSYSYSQERLKLIDAELISHMVRLPSTQHTVSKLSKLTGHSHVFILGRLKKLNERRAQEINKLTIEKYLSEFKAKIEQVNTYMWEIIENREYMKTTDVINAGRVIIENEKELFNKMFDSGIFARDLGSLDVNDLTTTSVMSFINANRRLNPLEKKISEPNNDQKAETNIAIE